MEIKITVQDEEILKLGKVLIEEELKKTVRWLKLKYSFIEASKDFEDVEEEQFWSELETVRARAWEKYKKYFGLK